jgi:transcriptional regulator with XRE-family HTH domain
VSGHPQKQEQASTPRSLKNTGSKNVIAARLRQARREKQVTQVDLAALLAAYGVNVNQASISKIEAGDRPVFDYEVKAIAEALVVNAGWLLNVEEL